jgi:transcriptional regulator with XRE-family HTH domain
MLIRIEHVRSNPTLLMIAKIAAAFDVDPRELVRAASDLKST